MPNSLLEEQLRLTTFQKKALSKLKLKTVLDLLYFFPVKYQDALPESIIARVSKGDEVSIYGRLSNLDTGKTWKGKMPIAKATLNDESGKIKIIWLHQAYIAKMFQEGSLVRVSGKVSERKGALSFVNPNVERIEEMPRTIFSDFGAGPSALPLEPTYRETRGLSSRWFHFAIQKILKSGVLEELEDPIPADILKKYSLPTLRSSLIWIHIPQKENDYIAARKRFAFEEIFFIQIQKQRERKEYEEKKSFKIDKTLKDLKDFTDRLPFKLTTSQEKSITNILDDFKKSYPMSRLLEGDVGSGKTAVAALTSYATITTPPPDNKFGELQVTYMAPTEILANQHFKTFIETFSGLGIKIGLITGSGCKKFPSKVNPNEATAISKSQLLKWVANGEIPILIGTHALIEKSVVFKNLAYVIIDEQHRFGTEQRAKLRKKDGILPHLLSMTATPIPRTLALTIYGDLDLTLLDQMPAGRKPVITEVVSPNERKLTYEKIREELKAGRQLYVICPRINEPDPAKATFGGSPDELRSFRDKEMALNVKSVTEEASRLKKEIFPEYEIGILHSKLKKDEKEEVMSEFEKNKIQILCATSVVEVGVNVPNATTIIIEGAERFGLAQLHQLRGRVLRSSKQAYCYIFSDAKSGKSKDRLKAMTTAKNGFELAEIDLEQRGSGDLSGKKQWGISDLGMEAIKNIKMVEAARNEAREIVESDPDFRKPAHYKLQKIVESQKGRYHFE